MKATKFDISRLRVASPCHVGWEKMHGDERVRRCDLCELNVFNIAELTAKEVERLIETREGRLCIRLYKRADGTVLTKDCPIGWRAYQKHVAKFAGAALTAILGLFSISFGQKDDKKTIDTSKIKIARTVSTDRQSVLIGTVTDPNGAVIPGAQMKLQNMVSGSILEATTDADGNFSFRGLTAGMYALLVSAPGFKKYRLVNIKINSGEEIELKANLTLDPETVTVGIFLEEPLIDTTSSSVTTKITREMIEKLPH